MNKRKATSVFVPAILIIILLALIAVPSFLNARKQSQSNACLNNLRQIDSGSESWAAASAKSRGDKIDVPEVCHYIKGDMLPICPAGGTYTGPPLGLSPRCSVHGALWEGQSTFPRKWEQGYLEAVQQLHRR
jgi:hypothetical protein